MGQHDRRTRARRGHRRRLTVAPSALFDLRGKVAYIPGGYGGIGTAIARGLADQGAAVAISGRDGGRASALASELASAGDGALGFGSDMHSVADIRDGVDHVVRELRAVDILVNCVGIQREESLLDVTEEAFDELYTVNLKAAMFLAQAVAAQQIRAADGGRQVHLLSVRSHLGLRGRGYSAYSSTKGGLGLLVKQHAAELAPHGITVNGVGPTFVRTELVRDYLADDTFRTGLESRIPLGRIAEPQDVAGPVIFLVSPAAAFVTGQILYVDGGITATQ
jgi:NAD(P)-dependent dehydrogenase (short-subunit alcohol dehydrogenase family)